MYNITFIILTANDDYTDNMKYASLPLVLLPVPLHRAHIYGSWAIYWCGAKNPSFLQLKMAALGRATARLPYAPQAHTPTK
jgi:hypothetical protein